MAAPAPAPFPLNTDAIIAMWKAKYNLHDEDFGLLREDLKEIMEMNGEDIKQKRIKQMDEQLKQVEWIKIKKIGGGAFGEVYHGVNRKTRQQVAIKIVDLEESKDDILTIHNEIIVLTQGRKCPQLVSYYGSCVVGTKLWILMELLAGGSINDKLKRAPLTEKQIAIVVREVLLGLQYLLTEGRFHRDIKAANILISTEGEVKLADFGASAQLTDTATKRNTFIGSPFWMAPEILQETPYDSSCDIWSLGITCLEMATAKPPYYQLPVPRALVLIANNPPPRLKGEYSDHFKDFVRLCLQKDPKTRPSIHELLKHPFVQSAGPTTDLRPLALVDAAAPAAPAAAAAPSPH